MDENTAVAALAALAQAARLRIFRALVGAGPAGLTPGTLAATLGIQRRPCRCTSRSWCTPAS